MRFGRYELVQRIGAGGMGEVWLARLPGLGGVHKVCVVKKMLQHLSSDRSFVKRFLDEAKVVVHLNHGNIAQVFEMGAVDDDYFISMEYVEGKTIARISARLRERGERFPLPLALYIGARACDALAFAHRRTDPATGKPLHVVHRDISPSNIMVSYEGEVKLIDFGAAQSSVKEAHTAPRVVIGNLAYMSPEQARKRPVDGRADVYSISVVLWELIAWSALPTGGDHVERWRRAAFPRFTPPSKLQQDVPPFLDQIIMRGLSQDAADRFPTAEELRDELQRGLNQLAAKTSQSTLQGLMETLFKAECADDKMLVRRALSEFDPETTDQSGAKRRPADEEPDEVTLPVVDASRAAPPPAAPRPPPPVPAPSPATRPGPPVPDDPDEETSTASGGARKPPPPVPDRSSRRGTDEMPTITWAEPVPRRRRHTQSMRGTTDFPSPDTVKRQNLLKVLLFVGAFVAGVIIAIAAYEVFAGAPEPEPQPAPTSTARPR